MEKTTNKYDVLAAIDTLLNYVNEREQAGPIELFFYNKLRELLYVLRGQVCQ